MTNDILTQDELKSRLHYNPETGLFTWIKTKRADFAGVNAGCLNIFGYVFIKINRVVYKAHRLAFLYITGEWPNQRVDHINAIKSDNRWCNLREATNAQNMQNTDKQSNNTSGFKGVDFDKKRKKWRARCKYCGKRYNLGLYDSAYLASQAYENFAKIHYGEFYRKS